MSLRDSMNGGKGFVDYCSTDYNPQLKSGGASSRLGRPEMKAEFWVMKRGSRALLAATLMLMMSGTAFAQTRAANSGVPGNILRQWPQVGVWQAVLGRGLDHNLVCAVLSGRAEAGHIQYVAGLSQRPHELSLTLSDVNKAAVSGSHIALIVDGVRVGDYLITTRVDDVSPLHSVRAPVPERETQRVMSLFRTGGTVQFVTDQFTYSFPLNGSAQSLGNMRDCLVEAANLDQGQSTSQ